MRYKIVLEYKGTAYCGWQRQDNGVSVQEVVEKAFGKLYGVPVSVTASGRTDAGVHAAGQVAHFDAESNIPANKIPFAVNTHLPDDVRVLECEQATPEFHARFGAKRKTYAYRVYVAHHIHPLKNDFATLVTVPLDVSEMRRAASLIVGTRDFSCFEATGSIVKDKVRTVYSLDVCEENGEIVVRVTGNGFLYNMVRIIAGTLVYVGTGKLRADDVPSIIESRDRTRAGITLPAKGLCLERVEYCEEPG